MTEIKHRSDIPVRLYKASASDDDVILAAKVSTQGQDVEVGEASEGFINFLMKNRHGSPFEHSNFTWIVTAPIFVWREHMRHRIASYNEESGRYKQLDPVFYTPAPDRNLVQEGRPGHYIYVEGNSTQVALVEQSIKDANTVAYQAYVNLLDSDIAKEVSRMLLPVNIYSSAFVTMNARALMNFLSLRTKDPDSFFPSYPQREIEMVAQQYESAFAQYMPITHASFNKNGRVAP